MGKHSKVKVKIKEDRLVELVQGGKMVLIQHLTLAIELSTALAQELGMEAECLQNLQLFWVTPDTPKSSPGRKKTPKFFEFTA